LRPILMTSLAFIFGTLPLAVATGAGAGAHVAIGVAVVSGMIGATIFASYFVPVFFVAVLRLFRAKPETYTPERGDRTEAVAAARTGSIILDADCEGLRVALGIAEGFERRHLHVIRPFGIIGAGAANADVGTGRSKQPVSGFNPLQRGEGRGLRLGN
jgi:AcrB/AcrD/AcrF family protein